MPPLQLLIKPASGNCNMRCKYCFYTDETAKRKIKSYGLMKNSTLETLVKKSLEYATSSCSFVFQGGEPTLVGIEFYKNLLECQKRYNVKKLHINNAIQTNGYIIDDEWAAFLGQNQFLVGLSLDGTKDIHDFNRIDTTGEGTYKKILHTIQLFNKHHVEYNILTVVTAQLAKNIGKVYGFYQRNNLVYQQYIPCLDPIGKQRGQEIYSLTPQLYGNFLMDLFDLWYRDIMKGKFIYNRFFDNLVGMLRGYLPESCGMLGQCSRQTVIEANGGVYPCDFYVLDEYKIGNIVSDSFEQIEENRSKLKFIETSRYVSPKCLKCKWYQLCKGGCRRDREPIIGEQLSLNYFCESYQMFYEYAIERLIALANRR